MCIRDRRRVNAKSLLGVLSLGIMGGTKIRIIAGGPDEEQAVEAVSYTHLLIIAAGETIKTSARNVPAIATNPMCVQK